MNQSQMPCICSARQLANPCVFCTLIFGCVDEHKPSKNGLALKYEENDRSGDTGADRLASPFISFFDFSFYGQNKKSPTI